MGVSNRGSDLGQSGRLLVVTWKQGVRSQALGWSEPTGNRREQTTRGQTLGGLKADDAELQKTLSPTLEISDG